MDTYKGTGTYWNADGSPDVNGGPVDGMIRTTNDMEWLRAMMEEGYSFYPQQGIGKQKIWYGEYIYADRNGDGLYGNSYDSAFQNRSTTPKVNYGIQTSLGWKGIDFSMSWAGAAGFSIYYYRQASNSSNTIYGYAIPQSLVGDRYFFDPKNPDDPRTNINSKNPRLVNLTSSQSSATSSLHLCKGDYLKLKNLTMGYTLRRSSPRRSRYASSGFTQPEKTFSRSPSFRDSIQRCAQQQVTRPCASTPSASMLHSNMENILL